MQCSRSLIVRTWEATPDALHQAKYVLNVTTQVMPIYEQLFDIDYPLPKLDTLIVSITFIQTSYPYVCLNRRSMILTLVCFPYITLEPCLLI